MQYKNIKIEWLGHSGFRIKNDRVVVYIDPYKLEADQFEAEKISSELDDLPLPYLFDLKVVNQISSPELIEHIKRVGISLHDAK